jgi:hypothetical protein
VKVSGLTQALKEHKADSSNADDEPKVRVSIELSDSGILSVTDATVSITSDKPATIAGKIYYGQAMTVVET